MRKAIVYLLVACLVFLAGCISPAPLIKDRVEDVEELLGRGRVEEFGGPPEEEEEATPEVTEDEEERPAVSSQYYPMAIGDSWTWRVMVDQSETWRRDEVIGTRELDGVTVFVSGYQYQYPGSYYIRHYYQLGDGYVAWFGKDEYYRWDDSLSDSYRPSPSPVILWKFPFSVGQEHEFQFTLEASNPRIGPYESSDRRISYVVLGMGAVDVPAGHFEGCYEIEKTLMAPSVGGILRREHGWFCPGVGFVRRDQEFPGHSSREELIDYRVR